MSNVLLHPTAIAASLKDKRRYWLHEAARFDAKGDTSNRSYCQGRAASFDEVIVMLGGEGISLSLSQFGEQRAVELEFSVNGVQCSVSKDGLGYCWSNGGEASGPFITAAEAQQAALSQAKAQIIRNAEKEQGK